MLTILQFSLLQNKTKLYFSFLSGYEVIVKKAGQEAWVDFLIPEADIFNPNR